MPKKIEENSTLIPGVISDQEKQHIQDMRKEGNEVKECFTQFSFRISALSATLLIVIIRLQYDFAPTAFACVPVVFIILLVVRIGIHKTETANRIFGYELHIYRRIRLANSTNNGWKSYMRTIGWEEALYAWRVIQPVLYNHVYHKYRLIRPTAQKPRLKEALKHRENRWFSPMHASPFDVDSKPVEAYGPGSYLQQMVLILHIMAHLSCLPLLILILQGL